LDVRIPPGMSASKVVEGIQQAARGCPEGVTIHLTVGEATDAYQADPGSNVVRALQRAILTLLPSKPSLVRKTGTGDMNVFATKSGAQCATYGPGMLGTSHTEAEAVEEKDYLDSIGVLKEAIRQLGGMPRGERQ
jgi:[amino group carrier protein]-lysine/ornithine hydrolase